MHKGKSIDGSDNCPPDGVNKVSKKFNDKQRKEGIGRYRNI